MRELTQRCHDDDGSWVTGAGEGTWQQNDGQHRWKMSFPVIEISDGKKIRSEGEIDLANRVYSGQISDARKFRLGSNMGRLRGCEFG